MSQPAPFAYRPDIDGLRGVAVLLVVLLHAHLSCRGGFIGVDVFFVISGYLITGLMRRDLEAGGFRLADFWERRARRILPALAVMALLTLAAGAWLLLPEDLARLGRSAMAQSLLKSRAALVSASGLVLLLLLAIGAWLSARQGLPERLPAAAARLASATASAAAWPDAAEAVLAGRPPRFGRVQPDAPARVLLWGDSHAKSLVPVLADACEEAGEAGLLVAHSATAPVLGFHRRSRHGLDALTSRAWAEAAIEIVRRERVPDTVLAAYWSKCHGRDSKEFGRALTDTVRRLRAAGTRVWIVLDVPVQAFAPPRALAYHALRPGLFRDPRDLAVTPAAHREHNAVMEALRAELEAAGARLLDPASLLFESDGRARLAVDGEALYADGDHLTEAGARLLRPLLVPIFAP